MPSDPVRALIELGQPHFAVLEDFPEAKAFWWPRFVRIANWFANWDARRRTAVGTLISRGQGPGTQDIFSGGTAISTTIDRGHQEIGLDGGGTAISTTINSGGEQDIAENGSGTAISTTINSGSVQYVGVGGGGFASSTTINSPNNQVGLLESISPTSGSSYTYSLVSGAGSTDNGSFVVSGNQ